MMKVRLLSVLLVTLFMGTTFVHASEGSKKSKCENVNPITGQCEDKVKKPTVSSGLFI